MSNITHVQNTFVVTGLGGAVRVCLLSGRGSGFEERETRSIRAAWSRCLSEDGMWEVSQASLAQRVLPKATHRYMARLDVLSPPPLSSRDGVDGRWRTSYVMEEDFGLFAQRLTTQVVVRLIENRRGGPLLFHSGAVADRQTGRVHALVATSGMGKTTAMRRLVSVQSRWGYVTDETVAVWPEDLRVDPFPKPLSVIRHPDEPKEQVDPGAEGFPELPRLSLQLSSISLLDRDPAHRGPAVRELLSLSEALRWLVPQSSGLAFLQRGLCELAELIDRLGGVGLIRYADAEDLEPLLDALPDPVRTSAEDRQWYPGQWWRPGVLKVDATPKTSPVTPGRTIASRSSRSWVAVSADDSLELSSQGQVALLLGEGFCVLSTLGALVWELCAQVREEGYLCAAVQAQLGTHPQAAVLVGQALEQLEAVGAVRQVNMGSEQ